MNKIHPTAIVDPKAEIGEDVEIGPYCVIDGGVRLGKGCRLDTQVRIKGRTTIGPNNQFFHSCIVGELPQDIGFEDAPHSTLRIGEGNTIREYVQIHASTLEKGTIIGNHNFIMSLSHIAHDVEMGDHNILVQACIMGGHSLIEDHVYLGGACGLHPHIRVGSHAIIGGMTTVIQDVPPYLMVVSESRSCVVEGVNSIGMRRANFSVESRKAIKRAYKTLFVEGVSVPKGLASIRKELLEKYDPNSEEYLKIKHFIEFSENSKRGITSGRAVSNKRRGSS